MAIPTEREIQRRRGLGFAYWCFSFGMLFTGLLSLFPSYDPRVPLVAGFGTGILGAALVALGNAMADTARKIRELEGSGDVSK